MKSYTVAWIGKPVWPDISTLRHVGWTVQRAEWIWLIMHPVGALCEAQGLDRGQFKPTFSLAVVWVEDQHLSVWV